MIALDYMAHGMRWRMSELVTEWLGHAELEMRESLRHKVEQACRTSMDRALQWEATEEGRVQVERVSAPPAMPVERPPVAPAS